MKEAMQSVWIGIWSLIEGGGDGLNMKKWDKLQRGVEKAYFSISHDHAKFSHSHAKWNRMGVGCSILREKWKAISHNHAKRFRKTKIMLMDPPLRTIVRSCWGSCENVFSLYFLDEIDSRRPFRWCQVSTWPWPIIETWLTHLETFDTFSNCRTFQISFLYIILYFPSFSLIFLIAKHVLWDQISKHEWLNLVFLGGGRI